MSTKTQLRKRMLKLLNETAQHYNSNNRSLDENGSCVYVPHDPTISEGCAIGRKLPKASKALIVEKGLNMAGFTALIGDIPLGKSLDGINEQFLRDLQDFHDGAYHWISSGLSLSGESRVKQLIVNIERGDYDQ